MPRKKKDDITVFDGAEITATDPPELQDALPDNVAPDRFSPEWHDYVMDFFEDEELDDGRPCVAGLRRVAQILLGPITDQYLHVEQAPNEGNNWWAVVSMAISFGDGDYNQKRFADAADCFRGNIDDYKLAKYPTAIATTRAEARVYRKALGLKRGVVAAEEVDTYEEPDDNTRINNHQINAINQVCKKRNINAITFLKSGSYEFTQLMDIPYSIAAKMIKKLAEFNNDNTKIPENLIGYEEGWNRV